MIRNCILKGTFWLVQRATFLTDQRREFLLSNCKTFVQSEAWGKTHLQGSLYRSVKKDERSNMRGIFPPSSTQPKKRARRKLFSGEMHQEFCSRNIELFLWCLCYQNTMEYSIFLSGLQRGTFLPWKYMQFRWVSPKEQVDDNNQIGFSQAWLMPYHVIAIIDN